MQYNSPSGISTLGSFLLSNQELNKAKLIIPSRIPPTVSDLQVNTCRNPICLQFGKEPRQDVTRGRSGKSDGYRIIGGWNKSRVLWCTVCGQSFSLKSNLAIAEEFKRLWQPHVKPDEPSCPNSVCINHGYPVNLHQEKYQNFGITTAGSRRYRCKQCRKTFSFSTKPTHRQRQPEKNEPVFKALINKVPMRRICELMDVRPAVLYQRLNFFQQQCERFARHWEQYFINGKELESLRIAVDRQDYVFNWGSQFDRRNTQLSAIASADNLSGYVFGMHLDFDPTVDVYEAELHSREIDDFKILQPYRQYARLWLPDDYESSSSAEIEEIDKIAGQRLPPNGARVRRDYTMFAHFLFLKKLLPGAKNIQFYLDPEANINAACLTAFNKDVIDGRVNAFLVRINKSLTINEKRMALAHKEQKFKRLRNNGSKQLDWELARKLMREDYNYLLKTESAALKRWTRHPLPHMGEPEKYVCCLTDTIEKSTNENIDMMLHASLHAVDRYFMQLRRRISLFERPIATASAARRVWHGTNPYNPQVATHLLAMFRVAHNFTFIGKDKKTAAMRIGLVQQPFKLNDILSFDES